MATDSEHILRSFATTLITAFKTRSIDRTTQNFAPPSLDPPTGVQFKDVLIAPEINLSARLFLPPNANSGDKLPLLLYFHGGGFALESALSPMYLHHLNHLVAEARVVAVSVDYRLAPEHPLPTAYEDSWLALKWAAALSDDWIRDYADLGRVYLAGDSAGGNIAHHMAIRVGSESQDGVHLSGVFLNCPFFYGKDPIGKQEEEHEIFPKSFIEQLWHFVCPESSGLDDPFMNPGKDPNVGKLGCKRVLVYCAEKDFLKDRSWWYKEALESGGWDGEIEVVEVEGEDHVFSVFFPEAHNSIAMFKKVACFINQ